MSITDELRKWWVRKFPVMDKELHEDFTAIADRIDAEHEALRDQLGTSERQKESYREDLLAANRQVHASYNDGFDDGFASADDWLAQHEDEMAENGWVRLPVDADGEYIHIGDRVENGERVVRIVLTDESWEPSVYIEKLPNVLHEHFCNEISHYHKPTVEDVLRELLVQAVGYSDANTTVALDAIAEYAAKLRLAEGEDA